MGAGDDLLERRRAIEARLQAVGARGVTIVDPRQTFIDEHVRPGRICAGVILHPGTRLCGPRTFLGPGAEVGRAGPATLRDVVLGQRARIDGGFAHGAVLLRDSSAGPNAHLRPGTLLEEEASTAHAVGLKHTILLSFVTLGSLINFCDALVAGGRSRRDHSEVGSGFIHFNFTPWGVRGDKATPSLCGDVVDGVFLDRPRIFLGGSAGMVGPRRVGYGAITGAGQVVRRDVAEGHLSVQAARSIDRRHSADQLGPPGSRVARNIAYIAQLTALRAWYRDVRLARIPGEEDPAHQHLRIVTREALATIELAIAERVRRLRAYADERGLALPALELVGEHPCPLRPGPGAPVDHVAWVQGLAPGDRAALRAWLAGIVNELVGQRAG